MSLVNDMLRDLDGRRASGDTVGGEQSLAPAQKAQEKRGLGESRIAVFVVVAVVATAAVLRWLVPQGEETQINRDYTAAQVAVEQAVERPASFAAGEPAASAGDGAVTGEVVGAVSPSSLSPASSASPNSAEIAEASTVAVSAQPTSPEQDFSPVQSLSAEKEESQRSIASAQPGSKKMPEVSSANATASLMKQDEAVGASTGDDAESARGATQVQAQQSSAAAEVADEPGMRRSTEMSVTQLDVVNVQEALALLAAGQEREAFSMLQDYVDATPGAHRSRETLIKLLLSRDQLEQAFKLVDAGLALAPNHQGFKKAKARLLIAGDDPGAAAALLMTRAPEASSDIEYYELLTSAQLAAGDYDGAARNYRQLLQVDSTQARWWYGFALSQDRLGNNTSAKQAYEQALQGTALSANLRRAGERRLRELQ